MVLPSIQPSLCSCCTKAAARELSAEGVPWYKKPMVCSFVACCARVASGHAAAAPPINVIKSRRLMGRPYEDQTLPHHRMSAVLCNTAKASCQCPLWVKSRHFGMSERCPLYPQKRTLIEPVVMSALCAISRHSPRQAPFESASALPSCLVEPAARSLR